MKYQKIDVKTETGMYITNHLLFNDDLKLLVKSDDELQKVMNKATK